MTRIYFADGTSVTTRATTEKGIQRIINRECCSDSCKDITDEIDCYNLEDDEQELVNKHKGDCSFYQTYDNVCGTWNQPLSIVAVEEDIK